MRNVIWVALATLGLMAGCDGMHADRDLPTGADATSTAPAPDNTGINERDVQRDTTTPIDQGNDQADLDRTAEIRKRVLDTENMSVNARNCKIITKDGKVTLRGPVASDAERDAIHRIAVDVAGEANVANQLEIAP